MRLLLLGPPGSGKGTQAQLLTQRGQLEHIGTGDLLREAIRRGTPVGLRAKPFVESGKLAPDDLVNDLIAERFRRPDRPPRFVMDGYPRTLVQAQAFDRLLAEQHLPLDSVLLLDVPDEEIVRRAVGRWSCPQSGCKATYNTESNPPLVPGICDVCGSKLVQREDDKEETVRRRLTVYHKNTEELIPHYQRQGLFRQVRGLGEIEEVYARATQALREMGVDVDGESTHAGR
jgi:adenylate kinase